MVFPVCSTDKTTDSQKGWNPAQGQHNGICCFGRTAILQPSWWAKWTLPTPLLCPLFLVVPKKWERRNNVGLRNLGHRLSLKCRMGSDKRHEGKNMPQTYQWWTALVHMWVASKHLWARTKVCLQQMDTVRRTLSQAVAETTALKKQ